MRVKLSKSACVGLEPEDPDREEIYWDIEGSGLGVRVTKQRKDGRRGRYFVFGYRTKVIVDDQGRPRRPKWRIYQLGKVARWTLQQAKDEVLRLNAEVNDGGDPMEARRAARRKAADAKTVHELAVWMMERHHGTTWEEPPPVGRKKVESKYVRGDRSKWKRWVLPRLGNKLVAEITTHDVDEVLREVAEKGGKTTANRVRALLSAAFNKAEVWSLRPQGTNPVAHAMKHAEQRRQRILTREELLHLLDAADDLLEEVRQLPENAPDGDKRVLRKALSQERQLLAILLATETMRRPDEIFRLEWRWVRFEDRIIALPRAKADRKGKVATGQTFGLSERAIALLERAKIISEESSYVFPSIRTGGSGHISTVKTMWARLLERAGIDDKPDLYSLKHTMISLSDEAGVELGGIKDQAGHGDIRTTEIYRRGTDERKIAAASALSEHVQKLRETRRRAPK